MRAVTDCAVAPLPAPEAAVLDPYAAVRPHSKLYVVACERGVTVPASMASSA